MPSLLERLSGHRWLHRLVGVTGIYGLAARVLARRPLERRFDGMVYRITSLDQLGIADEIFGHAAYRAALTIAPVETLIDLGCNAGWFTLWLAVASPNANRRALLVDANARMVAEAEWHMEQNAIAHHHVVQGAVGLAPGTSNAVFHVLPSASQSSLAAYEAPRQLPLKGRIVNVTVPAVSVSDAWRSDMGKSRVDLMKIDIEGAELDFVRYEGAFLRDFVREIIVEWHKWRVSLGELDDELTALGFERRGTFDETDLMGMAFYGRRERSTH